MTERQRHLLAPVWTLMAVVWFAVAMSWANDNVYDHTAFAAACGTLC